MVGKNLHSHGFSAPGFADQQGVLPKFDTRGQLFQKLHRRFGLGKAAAPAWMFNIYNETIVKWWKHLRTGFSSAISDFLKSILPTENWWLEVLVLGL